ncbi:MAG TPA: glycerol-3-phosphate 1-O-acyltransferase PlsY [Candidatus Acidoferrum sp.]|jgi:glycerol-3-phosphate acyltransferase PlsY|nr:glycerol-3-phosphate 1-O-acyltransferase PlsY [Candidatus Acidoferrum sp.]
MTIADAALTIVGAFLIGSIPFGYLIGRFAYRTDLRKHGSGNIGAMNALRTLGTKGAVAVLLLDAGKGALAVMIVTLMFGAVSPFPSMAATCAVLGHCFSPWLGWKGGKGVATAFGAIFALSWPAGLICVGAWLLGALVCTRYSSVGSIFAMAVSPFALFFFTRLPCPTLFGVYVAFFIVWTHRENIVRLRAGTEGPITLFERKA